MNNSSHFDQQAAQWDNNLTRVELARAVGTAMLSVLPVQRNWGVLDYGAGTGLVTLQLQPLVKSILAMDSSVGMLETLRQKLTAGGIENVNTLKWDLEAQPYSERQFELVASSMTFHHIQDIPLVLSRMGKLLKPGGWLAFADLDTEDGSFHGDLPGVFHKGFARPQVSEWLAGAGFIDISIRDAHQLRKPDQFGQLWNYSVFLAVGQKAALLINR